LPDDWPGPVTTRRPDLTDLDQVKAESRRGGTGEGFVVRFAPSGPDEPSLRVKVKFDEYLRQHRLLSTVTARTVWEYLAAGRPLDELVEDAPGHYVAWVTDTAAQLRADYALVEAECRAALSHDDVASSDRRHTAAYVGTLGDRAPVVFKMLDDRPYEQLVWRAVRPAGDVCFRPDLER
jgi:RNA ligase